MTKQTSPPTDSRFGPWNHLAADAVLWAVFVVLLLAFRGILLWHFRVQLSPESGVQNLLRCFANGIHYDIQTASFFLIPSAFMTLIAFLMAAPGRWNRRVRQWTVILGVMAFAVAFVTDAAYFAEYQDQFNHWIFGLIYDDRQAIFMTIWKSYPIVWLAIGMLVAMVAGVWGLGKLCHAAGSRVRVAPRFSSGLFRVLVPALMVVLVAVGSRGSIGRRPMQLKDAATTGDGFLNKLVLNPFVALRYAIKQHLRLQTSAGLESFLPDRDIGGAARAWFPQRTNSNSLDDFLIRTAPGGAARPDHIILVVLESYDFWPMLPRFAELGLTTNLSRMGAEGIQATAFVSAASGTMPTLTTIISGLPSTAVNANYRASIRDGLPTSIAPIFKRLGYRTRFFYGGYLSWQRLGEFCREQGFDEVYGGDQMSRELSGNEWGVDDEVLFRFVLDRTSKEPTFDVIMTTSYHPPFSLDLKSKGFSVEALAQTPMGRRLSPDELRIYGHLWYADHALGIFAADCERRLERPLLAVTGDHWSRRFAADARPTLFERKAVPFVLYGPKALAQVGRSNVFAGSHLDIAPTLINLVAPPGFSYHAFGRDMLDPVQPQLGFGFGSVVGTNFIFEIGGSKSAEDFQGQPCPTVITTEALNLAYNQLHALGWWRVMKDNKLK